MATEATYGDTSAKESFWGPILDAGKTVLAGAGQRLKETISKTPREGGYTSTSEQVGAGLFDVLYARLKSGSKASTDKAAELFRKTGFGKRFIDESTRLEIEAIIKNPFVAVGAILLVMFLLMRLR